MNGTMGRRVLAAGISVSMLVLAGVTASRSAMAWSEDIIRNCTEDYFAFCKEHSPESTELRTCMEANRTKISKQCVKALLDAGEVPKKYLVNAPQSQQKK